MKKVMSRSGFTIIEVALVIAVAGLIYTMLFVALPALRAQQRDTERRDNMIALVDKIKDYQTNNRGTLPISEVDLDTNAAAVYSWTSEMDQDGFKTDKPWLEVLYGLGENFADPDGSHYSLLVAKCNSVADKECDLKETYRTLDGSEIRRPNNAGFPNGYTVFIVLQAKCSGEKAVGVSNPRKVAVLYKLEGAGTYCVNS